MSIRHGSSNIADTDSSVKHSGTPSSPRTLDLRHPHPEPLFAPLTFVQDIDEFGAVFTASPSPTLSLPCSSAIIRILPIANPTLTNSIRQRQANISSIAPTSFLPIPIGVWQVDSETWIVSEHRPALSLKQIFAHRLPDPESLFAYVAYHTLTGIQSLHENGFAHRYLTPKTIHISANGKVHANDPYMYDIIQPAMASRRALPGEKVWPPPESFSPRRADLWDLSTTLIELADGGIHLSRCARAGGLPRLASTWSPPFHSFINSLLAGLQTNQLLKHRFVNGVSSSTAWTAVKYFSVEQRADDEAGRDVIATLFNQNEAVVQAPLINIDDIGVEMFSCEEWKNIERGRPTVEMSFLRAARGLRQHAVTTVPEENARWKRIAENLESFLETADMM